MRKISIIMFMITSILTLSFLLSFPSGAITNSEKETIVATASGSCGTGVFWEYFEDTQTLYIHGKGAITSSPGGTYKENIKEIIVGNEITSIYNGAFMGCSKLEKITIPFVGASATACNESGTLGHIFGRVVQRFEKTRIQKGENYAELMLSNCEEKISQYSGRFFKFKDYLSTANRYIFNPYNERCDNFDISGITVGYDEKAGCYKGKISDTGTFAYSEPTDFVNYKVSLTRWTFGAPSKTIWQYSAYDHFASYQERSDSSVYDVQCYYLTSYYYYIPSSLKTVNITNTSRIPVAAFNNCKNIDTINIYSNISFIGDSAFQMCDAEVNYFEPSPTVNTYTNGIDTFTYSVQNGNATLLGCQTSNDAITIPDCFDHYPVTSIGYRAFAENNTIKSILLPTTVTEIGDYAFYNCTSLKNVTLGTNLAKIGKYAFYNTALTKVTLPASLRTIDNYAFANCLALNKLVMRSGVETLGDGILYNATSLAMVTLSDTLERISDFSFYNCQSLAEINIPESVSKIGNCAFENCSALTKVSVAGNVEYMGKKAFYACNFSNFNFGNKLTYLGADSFSLTPITEVDLPNTVTQIGVQAFSDCQMLGEIYVPDSVIVGANALYNNATNLIVTIRYNTGSIPNHMFYQNKMSCVIMKDGITDIGEYAFAECADITEISFPETLKNIGDYAFYKSKLPVDIILPQNVMTIGNYAFSNVAELSRISLPDSIQKIGTKAFDSSATIKVYYRRGIICSNLFYGQLVKSIYVDDKINCIGDSTFSNCSNLSDLSLPDTIVTIGNDCFTSSNNIVLTIRTVDGKIDDEAFRGKISNIKTVNLDNSNIGDYAFADNASIEKVTISATSENFAITSIGSHAFEGCAGLTDLVLPDSVINFGSHAFYGCTSLVSVNIPSGVTQIFPYTFYNCLSLANVTLPQTVLSIGEYAFYGCSDMTAINIPSEIKTIPNYVFYGCTSLKTIEIPDAVTNIGDYAFYGCIALHSVGISDYCVSIGNYAFYNCKSLVQTAFPDSLNNIGNYAFASCSKLTDISLRDSVEILGEGVFHNCTELRIVNLGKGIRELPQQVFGGCYNLENIYIFAPMSVISEYAFYGAGEVTAHIGYDEYMINFFEKHGIDYVIMDDCTYEYKITFATDNGDVIISEFYAYGSTVIPPAPPSKTADNTYTYVFAGWDQEITIVGGHKTYTAIFTPVYIEYPVVFKNYDGSIISTETYHYGDDIVIPKIPNKPSDNIYTYQFNGWDSTVTVCEGNAIYTATYLPTYIEYTIIFIDEDNTVLSTRTYHYGDLIVAPEAPTKTADNTYTYTFAGWDKEFGKCEGNETYKATYTSDYIDYTVIFKTYNGDVISTKTYHYGDAVVTPSNPKKPSDENYYYVFAGWDKSVTDCYSNAEYTAIFTAQDLPIVTVENSSARANETVVVNILLSGAPDLESLAISDILYNTNAFELVNVEWKISDAILSNWDVAIGKGALALLTPEDLNGTIISLSFEVKEGTADGNYPVSCTVTSHECDFKNVAGQITVFSVTTGDVDGNESVDKNDAIYLLMHSFFPEDYPINQEADFNGNGTVDKDDAIHLLMHTFFPDDYPLAPPPATVTFTTTEEHKKKDEEEGG